MKLLVFLPALLVGTAFAQPCDGPVTFSALYSLFQLRDEAQLTDAMEAQCFRYSKSVESLTTIKLYEKRYEVDDGSTIYTFNEIIYLKNGRVSSYRCSDPDQCDRILSNIKKQTAFLYSLSDPVTHYLQKNSKRKFILRNICSASKCDYDLSYETITATDESTWREQIAADPFPANEQERSNLQYGYANIDSKGADSEIMLEPGDKVAIEAEGSITFGSFAGSGGPDGIDGFTSYSKEAGFRHGSLLYRVGSGNWEAVGKRVIFTARAKGLLQFMVNDNDMSNNSGIFHAAIKIIPRIKES